MRTDDPLQQNIRRATSLHALRKIRTLVDTELADELFKVRALRWMGRYGWLALPLLALLAAYLLGVM
ncbi:MAG: hypothetical protein WC298_09190 [Sideroxydans sp.]|jgi:hypothetical protein